MIRQECMICRKKRNHSTVLHLQQILQCLEPMQASGQILGLMWGTRLRCPYGMYCNDLQIMELKAIRMEKEIESKLTDLFEQRNERVYHELLQKLRGHYPAIYQYVEREWSRGQICP